MSLSVESCPRCGSYVESVDEADDGTCEFACINVSCDFSLTLSDPA